MGSCVSTSSNDGHGEVAPVVVTGSTSDVANVSAVHVFTIRRYSGVKGIGVGKSIVSSYFPIGGRSWFIRFYPDGYSLAEEGFVSFYLQTLYRPQFRYIRVDFAFSLLNTNGDPVHTMCTVSPCIFDRVSNSWGIRRFIARHQLESMALGALHPGDSLAVRCTVRIIKGRITRPSSPHPGRVDVPVPPSCCAENARRFFLSGKAPFDVEFDVSGAVFRAHRVVVASQSPYFEALFYGSVGKKEHQTQPRVTIEEWSPEAFGAVLHYIYHEELPKEALKGKNAEAMAWELFAAADMYLMQRMKLVCASNLCRFINDGTVEDIKGLAEAYSCNGLRRACESYEAVKDLSCT